MKIKESGMYDYIQRVVQTHLEYTDCDGCTRAVGCLLDLAGIKFKIFTGQCIAKDDDKLVIPLHYWIVDEEGDVWDFKSYKWIKKESHECRYIPREDVTETFNHGIDTLKILVQLAPTIGKEQDAMFERITGRKLHRQQTEGEKQ